MNRDFNFFSPYIEVKRTSKVHRRYIILSAVLVLGTLSGLLIWNISSINRLEKEIAEKEKYLSSPAVKKSLKEYEATTAQINRLDKYYNAVSGIDNAINRTDVIKTTGLDSIAAAIPANFFLQSMASSDASLSLVGTADNKTAIAEFERNLKQIKGFEEVHVSSIKKQDNYFISTINIKMKEVAQNEAD